MPGRRCTMVHRATSAMPMVMWEGRRWRRTGRLPCWTNREGGKVDKSLPTRQCGVTPQRTERGWRKQQIAEYALLNELMNCTESIVTARVSPKGDIRAWVLKPAQPQYHKLPSISLRHYNPKSTPVTSFAVNYPCLAHIAMIHCMQHPPSGLEPQVGTDTKLTPVQGLVV